MVGIKPIIFLDFDGVVETIYWDKNEDGIIDVNVHKAGKIELNNKQAIGWLNELYRRIPYDVVVTSTWRLGKTVEELQALFYNSGFDPEIKIIGKTDRFDGSLRGDEIRVYLCDHPEIKDFIIIDDDNDMLEFTDRLIKTDCLLGFTIYDFNKALKMLGEE